MLYVQYSSTKRTQRTIKHHGPKLWTSLYNSIPTDCAIRTFKQKLKAFLLPWHLSMLFDIPVVAVVITIIVIIIIIIITIVIIIIIIIIVVIIINIIFINIIIILLLYCYYYYCCFSLTPSGCDFPCTILAINVFSLSCIIVVIVTPQFLFRQRKDHVYGKWKCKVLKYNVKIIKEVRKK